MSTPAKLNCPTCKANLEWSTAFPQRPFCSQRCKDIDLGAWASNTFAIDGAPLASPEEAAAFEHADDLSQS